MQTKARAEFLANLRTFDGEGSLTYLARPNLIVGASFLVNPIDALLKQHSFGVSWNPAGTAFVGLKYVSKKHDLGEFFIFIHHAASAY